MASYNEKALQTALTHFSSVTDRFPESDVLADAWFMKGETRLALQQPAAAARAYASAVHVENASREVLSKALFRQGFALYQAEQYGEAIVVLKNFLQKYPADGRKNEALLWLGERIQSDTHRHAGCKRHPGRAIRPRLGALQGAAVRGSRKGIQPADL